MRRALLLAVAMILVGWTRVAGADVRPDKPRAPNAPEPSSPPDSPPVPGPSRVEPQGCAGREMAPEWMFGLGVLALGVTGMRRYRARPATA
jgi:hypothetical protein